MSVYLDENATAYVSEQAAQEAIRWLTQAPANPSSVHQLGRAARGVVERSRRAVAESLSVSPRHITFTSGATEALHTLICGVTSPGDHVLVSAVEHPATWGALERAQVEVEVIGVDAQGRVDPLEFTRRLRPETRLGVMMAAQNELGVIYPTHAVADALGEVPLLVDAAQAYGKVYLDLMQTGATYAVVSGHKMGAPLGVGAIWCREGAPFQPLLSGGAQERGRRAGTENVAAIAGFGVAAREVSARLERLQETRILRDWLRVHLEERLGSESPSSIGSARSDQPYPLGLWSDLKHSSDHSTDNLDSSWYGWRDHGQLANTLCLYLGYAEGDLTLQQLDLAGYCVSSGSACASGALEPSPTLMALGLSHEQAKRGLRVSMSPQTTRAEVEGFAIALVEALGLA